MSSDSVAKPNLRDRVQAYITKHGNLEFADPSYLTDVLGELTDIQIAALDVVMIEFHEDPHLICEAMGMSWDGNGGWG